MENKEILSEVFRMKSLFDYQRGVVVSEQTVPGSATQYQKQNTQPQSEEQQIANQISLGTLGPATNEEMFVSAIEKIKDLKQFYNINSAVKKKQNLDIEGLVNDEFEGDDRQWVDRIIAHLNKLGIKSQAESFRKDNKDFKPKTFKITKYPQDQQKSDQIAQPAKKVPIPTELKDVNGVKFFQSWLDKNHPGWHTKYKTLDDNVQKGYGIYGPNTQKAWTTYKKDYLAAINQKSTTTTEPTAEPETPVRPMATVDQNRVRTDVAATATSPGNQSLATR